MPPGLPPEAPRDSAPAAEAAGVGWRDRLRSRWYELALHWSERGGRAREPRPEPPCGRLPRLDERSEARIDALRTAYGIAFEQRLGARSALTCYEYLDWLDAAFATWGRLAPRPPRLHDVGCGGFAYAPVLARFFAPRQLVGVDLEGYRRLRGGVNRRERVLGHLASLPGAEFVIADYATFDRPADYVTAFFPFVTPGPVLAWRLPLRVLAPAGLFAAVRRNLVPSGRFLMVNHSRAEHATAATYAAAGGFHCVARVERPRLCAPDLPDVVVSEWQAVPTRDRGGARTVEIDAVDLGLPTASETVRRR